MPPEVESAESKSLASFFPVLKSMRTCNPEESPGFKDFCNVRGGSECLSIAAAVAANLFFTGGSVGRDDDDGED